MLFVTLLPYLLAAGSLILVFVLFYGVTRWLRKLRNRVTSCEKRIETEAAQLTSWVTSQVRRLDELETSLPAAVSPTGTSRSVNNTVRTKALKMHRSAQSTEITVDA